MTTAPEPLDPRVGELLSAYADGAVSDEERVAADAWIERSPAARSEYAALTAVRTALRRLPPVEPPTGFFEAMLERGSPVPDASVVALAGRRRRPPPAAWLGAAVAAAAAWVVVAGAGVESVTPPVDAVEDAAADRSASAVAPTAEPGGVALVADGDPVTMRTGDSVVAVARQDGDPDWAELPRGRRDRHDGNDVWIDLTAREGVARIVVVRGVAVYTLVSEDVDAEALVEIGARLPDAERDDGPLGRIRRASEALLEALGLD